MNGAPLPVAHGAPLRLRVERQLGYKQAKYIMRIEAVDSFAKLGAARAASGKTAATSGTRGSELRVASNGLGLRLSVGGRALSRGDRAGASR